MAQSRKLIPLNSVFFAMSIAKICSTKIMLSKIYAHKVVPLFKNTEPRTDYTLF